MTKLPQFDDLPPVDGMPQGCSWGIFDQNGEKDMYGTLNLLTPEAVQAAAAEIRQGVSISLNWPLGSIKIPGFFRKSLERQVMKLEDPQSGKIFAFDDEIHFNTQASSQWDSLCHVQHLPSELTYNGFKATVEGLENAADLPTLNRWHDRGCVVGRGVLIDFVSYAEAKGIDYSPFSGARIGPDEIEAIAAHQGTTFQEGDILIIRFGFSEALGRMTGNEQGQAMAGGRISGVEGSVDMARWLWNRHFAAIACDNIAVEALPPIIDGQERPPTDLVLHPWCLSLMGMPLGELWDLQKLADKCRQAKKYSFFLTSAPLNVPGAVGSPPNAVAIL
ncbi:hypothetical protein FE257_003350 [Aspergillus nanangensis]|uniref:Cyclase family protein n=1 Tax=Aspergillus nanangensis TaxID=2582783 RepID=A0AAD4GWN3_ASPNN|nr:hypothetical protein FE257_003350 [Aspergillus nanangensis]